MASVVPRAKASSSSESQVSSVPIKTRQASANACAVFVGPFCDEEVVGERVDWMYRLIKEAWVARDWTVLRILDTVKGE